MGCSSILFRLRANVAIKVSSSCALELEVSLSFALLFIDKSVLDFTLEDIRIGFDSSNIILINLLAFRIL